MKFAVVGQLSVVLPLIRQIHRSHSHELLSASLDTSLVEAVARDAIPIRLESSAENALLSAGAEAVVLAVDTAEQALQLARSALQSDRHVIVFAPPDASTAFGFELQLLFDEAQHAAIPVCGRMHFASLPLDRVVLSNAESDGRAKIRQIDLDLPLLFAEKSQLRNSQLLALDAVAATGLRYNQITALDANAPDGQLISRRLILGASAVSEKLLPPATITIHSSRVGVSRESGNSTDDTVPRPGSGTAEAVSRLATLQLVFADGSIHRDELLAEPELLDRIVDLCQSRDRCRPWLEAFSSSLELSDAADKSLRRRRTVDVYFDSGSERSVFKSYMTAIGCGVLTWMMLGMVGFLVIAKVANLPPAVLEIGRILWIAPIVIFLFVQFLLPLTRSREAAKRSGTGEN